MPATNVVIAEVLQVLTVDGDHSLMVSVPEKQGAMSFVRHLTAEQAAALKNKRGYRLPITGVVAGEPVPRSYIDKITRQAKTGLNVVLSPAVAGADIGLAIAAMRPPKPPATVDYTWPTE
jgi:hypothetical protein